jgi:dUTP pyrophosphatase
MVYILKYKMGSVISNIMNSISITLDKLEDYLQIYNSHYYYQYKDLYYYENSGNTGSNDGLNDGLNDGGLNDGSNDGSNDGDYYKLYIYVHDAETEENSVLKTMYEDSTKKHNASVDSYLQSNSSNLLTEKEVEENKFVNCYDSGFDLFCPENIEWQDFNIGSYMLDHKISCAMTYKGKFVGYYLYMRSSTPMKTPLRLANNVGIIDSGYRGAIKACFDIKGSNFNFVKGHRYMQICPPNIGLPMKVVIVDAISVLGVNNARSSGGYGSTGN